MNKFEQVRQLVSYFGPSWLAYRLSYSMRMRSGLLRLQLPAYRWRDRPLSTWLKHDIPSEPEHYVMWRKQYGGRFFFDTLPLWPDSLEAVKQANSIIAGWWPYFSCVEYNVGFPPDWHHNPATGEHIEADKHWSQIGDFAAGDIKFVWEASRFGVVYALVRAYAATKDERYPAAFWRLIEDWSDQNPPQMGPNWKCGQEATFRLMAWCFGLYGFAASVHSAPERIVLLANMIASHANRIEHNIAYARSQKNNHGLSEGVGLWTVGLLFPEFSRSAVWRDYGRSVIVEEIRRQLYDDGSYVQHSSNYHRLMLHDCVWTLRLGELNELRFPTEIYEHVAKATDFLYQLIDISSGFVPNYGSNDGALIFPLNNCNYNDYRPVLQTTYYLCHQRRLFTSGAWDEDVLWLFGNRALEQLQDRLPHESISADTGGYYTLRGSTSWAMIRCAHYRDRPGQADQLHIDLWWKGINIACDAGTYLYNGPSPWDNGLTSTLVHNTVSVDNLDQMTRARRFLWLDWAQGRVVRRDRSEFLEYWEGEHYGYERLSVPVQHRRGILRVGDETWLVLDAVDSDGLHDYRLHWLLPDLPYTVAGESVGLSTPAGEYYVQMGCYGVGDFSLVRADPESVRGWRSLYYSEKVAALSFAMTIRSQQCLFWTLFSSTSCRMTLNPLTIKTPHWTLSATMGLLLQTAEIRGIMEDSIS